MSHESGGEVDSYLLDAHEYAVACNGAFHSVDSISDSIK